MSKAVPMLYNNPLKEAKNIDMSPRADASAAGNISKSPVRVVPSTSSNKLRIKIK